MQKHGAQYNYQWIAISGERNTVEENDRKYMWYSEVQSIEIKWLWYPYIPYGKISVLQGDPGCGKSMMMVDLISRFTTRKPLPDGNTIEPINVIYQCSEDGLEDTIRPRLEAAKADCSRVACINEDLYAVTLDNEILKQAITDLNAKLLVIDPFQAYLGESDLSSAVGMRRVLKKLGLWASKYGCAVVLVGHLNKKSGQKELYRGLGSVDIMALARSVMQLEKVDDDSKYRILRHVKASLTSLADEIYFGINESGEFEWTSDRGVYLNLTDATRGNEQETESNRGGKTELVEKLLLQMLSNGPIPAKSAVDYIQKKGVGDRTIKSVKVAMNVESVRKNGIWYWQLPQSESGRME